LSGDIYQDYSGSEFLKGAIASFFFGSIVHASKSMVQVINA